MLLYFLSATLSVCVLLLFIRNEILQNVLKVNFMQHQMLNFVSDVHVLGIEHFCLSRSLWQLPPDPSLLPPSVEARENLGEVSGQCTPCKQKPPCPPQTQMFFIDPPSPATRALTKIFRLSVCLSASLSFSLYYANTVQTLLHHKTGRFSPEIGTATVSSLGHVNRWSCLFAVISTLLLLRGCVQLTG